MVRLPDTKFCGTCFGIRLGLFLQLDNEFDPTILETALRESVRVVDRESPPSLL